MKRILGLLSIILLFVGCGNDDDDGVTRVPPRLLSEVEPENRAEILAYLRTHFYNYEEFQSPPADFDFRIRVDTIAGENSDKIPLIQQVDSAIVNVSSSQFGINDGEDDIPHQYYFLTAREGGGSSPTIADSTLLRFEGTLLNRTTFDSTNSFSWQELPFFVRGYANGVSQFRAGSAEGIVANSDGTVDITDSGIGLIVMPSGLGFFNSIIPGIPIYSPIVFTVELGTHIVDTDNDGDGIPSILEDMNGNSFLFDDNTDADSEESMGLLQPIVNFQDPDDDNDGILTRDEIIINTDGTISFPDTDGDGTPDYLDADS